uniref:Uncharacterized protein n=1 Tax=Spongospora subterranea TaxID=70186 RepID=A0A0H5QXM7_9EUKA|eukprot:CRZ06700.1 hypothetical protein [Spongospora subterranea]
MRKHLSIAHPESSFDGNHLRQTHVQTIFKGSKLPTHNISALNEIFKTGTKTSFFAVNPFEPLLRHDDLDVNDVAAAFDALNLANQNVQSSARLDERCRHPFFMATNWDRKIEIEFGLFEPKTLLSNLKCENSWRLSHPLTIRILLRTLSLTPALIILTLCTSCFH